MKVAKVRDYWKSVSNKKYNTSVTDLTCAGILLPESSNAAFVGGINAFCGRNGSGKSTIIKFIGLSLGLNVDADGRFNLPYLNAGSFQLNVKVSNTNHSIGLDFSTQERESDAPTIECLIVDIVKDVPHITETIKSTQNLSEILDSLDPKSYNPKELELASYLVGSDYSEIQQFEIEELYAEAIIPYFIVTKNGVTYGSENMGLGEYSIFFLHWLLSSCASNSVILLEEPESFITPESQLRISNFFAMQSTTRNLFTILTTHSEYILKNIPHESIHLINNGLDTPLITPCAQNLPYLEELGLNRVKRGILFVEDHAAKLFLRLVLATSPLTTLKEFDIAICHGEGNIQRVLNCLPDMNTSLRHIGVFDGDVNDKIDTSTITGSFVTLPGDECPENVFKTMLSHDGTPHKISQKNKNHVTALLTRISTLDKHDWMHELSKQLDLEYEQAFLKLFEKWFKIRTNRTKVNSFLKKLTKLTA